MRKRRDNAVINSVWTSSVCMQGSPLGPPRVTGQWGICFFFFASFLVSGVCSCCVVCSDDRNTCKRGSLVPADKRMLRVTGVQLTLGFKSDPVWSGHPFSQWNPTLCGQGFLWLSVWRCRTSNDQYILHCLMFFWQLKVFIYLPCSMECQSWYYPWSHAFKVIALYKMCSIYDVMHNYQSINWGFRSEDIKYLNSISW